MLNKSTFFISLMFFVGIWQILSLIDLPFIPSPVVILKDLMSVVFWSEILPDFAATMVRFFLGFSGAIIVGIPLGLLMGYYAFFYRFLSLPVDFFRSLPCTAYFPLFMLFFGIGDLTKVILIMFSCSLIMMIHTASGVRQGVMLRRMAAKTMGASNLQIFTKIVFYDTLPQIFTGIKVILSLAMIIVVVLEMFIGTKSGIGKKIYDYHMTYQINYMYSVIIVIGLTSFLLNRLHRMIEKRIVHWAGK